VLFRSDELSLANSDAMNMRSHVDDNTGRKRHHDSADDRGYYRDRNQRGYQMHQPSGLYSARDEFARDNGGRNYYGERCPTWQCAEVNSYIGSSDPSKMQ